MDGTTNDLIIHVIRESGATGITAIEIELRLEGHVGRKSHQTITGNLRHLVEDGEVVQIADRHARGAMRHVYICPQFHSVELHGPRIVQERRARVQQGDEERANLRRRVDAARADSAVNQIRNLIDAHPEGITCSEIEAELGLRHETASARLAELFAAGLVTKAGKRRLPGDRQPQSVYVTAREPLQTRIAQPSLFDG
jgi:hypothetical protein